MANHALPTLTSTYTNYTTEFSNRINDVALGLDPANTTVTNPPTNAIRWTSAANRWEKWNGTAWAALTATYAISISGSAATLTTARTINGVSFNGSANITVTANTTTALTVNSGGAGVASGTTFNGSTARTISYNSLGATAYGWNLASAADAAAARTALGVTTLDQIYPVGSIYINATNATNPATLLGVGTWVAFGIGRVPIGFNAGDPLLDAAEKTGGSKHAIVVGHSHTVSGTTSTNGEHTHGVFHQNVAANSGGGQATPRADGFTHQTAGAGNHAHTFDGSTSTTGAPGLNANLPPFVTVYMWKRTA